MKISGRRSTVRQLSFFPTEIRGMPECRNHCGEFIEELTAAAGYAYRLKTDGTADYCPDLQRTLSDSVFYETKSVGHNGAAIIYEARREKDRRFCAESRQLFYWFWRHDLKVNGIGTVEGLRGNMAMALQYAIVLPFFVVDRIAESFPLRTLNKQYTGGGTELGYGNRSKGYGNGRSIRMTSLRNACNSVALTPRAIVLGVDVPPIQIHFIERFSYLLNPPSPDESQW